MRVNIYGEEYDDFRVELVEKHVEGYTFYGVRLLLKFPNQEWWIHRKVSGIPDDDSSAITIWGRSKRQLESLFTSFLMSLYPEGTIIVTTSAEEIAEGIEDEDEDEDDV